ncbi:MAG: FtsX-like permease family protein, partial [candidate division WWE3 bacterium]|nr:FtsX-like permease family protein [candidate division WWE3 bacterium]
MVVMLLTVFERRREFGIIKAAGWSNWNIISSVVVTSLTISIIGAFFGLGLGIGVSLALEKFLAGGREIVAFTPATFLWAAGVGIVTGLLGGILPAIQAARVSPIETLRWE